MKKPKDSIIDGRGNLHKIGRIHNALKINGLKRRELLEKDDTEPFWKIFFISGACFAVGMKILVFVGLVATGLFTGNFMLSDMSWSPIESAIYFVAYGTAMGFIATKFDWKSPERAQRAMLRAGLCVACAYPIHDIPSEPDGCTVCPECGAAWGFEQAESD
jgi:hypothetical protein